MTLNTSAESLLRYARAQIADSVRVHDAVGRVGARAHDTSGADSSAIPEWWPYLTSSATEGSAAAAAHWAAELTGRFYQDRLSLPAFALTENAPQVTAIANDYGFDEVFARPLSGIIQAGDAAIGISTSGNSQNVVRGLEAARKKRALTVGFTGATGGALVNVCDVLITVPSEDTPRIQEGHELCGHVLCALVERLLFGDENGD